MESSSKPSSSGETAVIFTGVRGTRSPKLPDRKKIMAEDKIRQAELAVRRATYFLDTCGSFQREAANAIVEKRKEELSVLRKAAQEET